MCMLGHLVSTKHRWRLFNESPFCLCFSSFPVVSGLSSYFLTTARAVYLSVDHASFFTDSITYKIFV